MILRRLGISLSVCDLLWSEGVAVAVGVAVGLPIFLLLFFYVIFLYSILFYLIFIYNYYLFSSSLNYHLLLHISILVPFIFLFAVVVVVVVGVGGCGGGVLWVLGVLVVFACCSWCARFVFASHHQFVLVDTLLASNKTEVRYYLKKYINCMLQTV